MPHEITALQLNEVSVVDRPANAGARVVLMKRDDRSTAETLSDLTKRVDALLKTSSPNYEEKSEMGSLSETIMKALAPDEADTDKERAQKQVVKMALDQGVTTVEKVAAHAILEGHASSIRKAHPELSAEQAYVKALDLYPEVARMAIG